MKRSEVVPGLVAVGHVSLVEKLQKCAGQEVTLRVRRFGRAYSVDGVIRKITPGYVDLGGVGIPFFGVYDSIASIVDSNTGKKLYERAIPVDYRWNRRIVALLPEDV